jgi:hypothetical protein
VIGATNNEQRARQIAAGSLAAIDSGGVKITPQPIHLALRRRAGLQEDRGREHVPAARRRAAACSAEMNSHEYMTAQSSCYRLTRIFCEFLSLISDLQRLISELRSFIRRKTARSAWIRTGKRAPQVMKQLIRPDFRGC